MVTWGENTVHTFGSAAGPAPSTGFSFGSSAPAPAGGGLFGAPAPAPAGGLFGSPAAAPSGGGLFGTAAPAPSGGAFGSAPASSGGLFGSSPAPSTSLFGSTPASSGGLFGSSSGGLFGSAPAPSGGLFGSTPAPSGGIFGSPAPSGSVFGSAPAAGGSLFGSPTPSTGLFGAPAPSTGLFGAAPAPGIFGATAPAQPMAGPQIPAQAAMQAHMDASARQEEARVQHGLSKLFNAYKGLMEATETDMTHPFATIIYNPATPEERQRQLVYASIAASGGSYMLPPPPKPTHVSERDWEQAAVRNPNVQDYTPAVLVGAESLQARLSGQQEYASALMKQYAPIEGMVSTLQRSAENFPVRLLLIQQTQDRLRKRFLDVMKKIELARCFNQPLQHDELEATQQMVELYKRVDAMCKHAARLADDAKSNSPIQTPDLENVPEKKQLMPVLQEHRNDLTNLALEMKQMQRDLTLIGDRMESKAKVARRPPVIRR